MIAEIEQEERADTPLPTINRSRRPPSVHIQAPNFKRENEEVEKELKRSPNQPL